MSQLNHSLNDMTNVIITNNWVNVLNQNDNYKNYVQGDGVALLPWHTSVSEEHGVNHNMKQCLATIPIRNIIRLRPATNCDGLKL